MSTSAVSRRRPSPMDPLLQHLESAEPLDQPGKTIGRKIRGIIAAGPFKDALSGTWLGHAVHPMLTDVVIGSFTSATLLDLLAADQTGRASERLIAVGIAAYPPTALTGANDWADTEIADETVRRVGLVHAGTNACALILYTASLIRRRRGARRQGALLSGLGAVVLAAGGYLGGHLSLSKGVGPDQTVFDPGPSDWTSAGDAEQVRAGELTRVVVDDTPVVLTREAGQVFALHDRCSHRGCSLSEGERQGSEIVCACHGSRFDYRDGSVRRGPATAPQPAFEVRERDGKLELRLRPPSA